MRRIFTSLFLVFFTFTQITAPASAWVLGAVPIATRLLPYTAGLLTRGTTWLATSVGANSQLVKIGEVTTLAIVGPIVVSYLMAGEQTSPANNGRLRAVIALKPDQPRENPDSQKWDDAAPGQVEPTPKASLPGNAQLTTQGTLPSTPALIAAALTAGIPKLWTDATNIPRIYQKVTNNTSISNTPLYLSAALTPVGANSFVVGDRILVKSADIVVTPTTNPTTYDHLYEHRIATATNTTRALTAADFTGCASGYTFNNTTGTCNLVDATQVKKPDMPCEVHYVNGTWQADSRNPSCINANAPAFTGGAVAKLNYSDASTTTVERNPAGGVTITDTNPTQGITKVETGPWNTTSNGYPVTAVTQTPPGATGTGTGTGTGSCGGAGQTPCSIDDSGFTGKTVDATGVNQKIAAITTDYQQNVATNNNDHGISWQQAIPDTKFGLQRVACQPLAIDLHHLGLSSSMMSFDPCNSSLISTFRAFEAFLLYVFTVYYIWRRFNATEVPPTNA
jgi:hypothetical protein